MTPPSHKVLCKVLIVDDERRTRENLSKLVDLRDDCTVVAIASDGEEALTLARKHTPQIILCDIRMPKMTGVEFGFAIKEEQPACIVIFLSGYSDKDYLMAAIKLGVFDYIEKPIIIDELHIVLDKAVAQYWLEHQRESNRQRRVGMLKIYKEEVEQKIIVDLVEQKYTAHQLIDYFKKINFKKTVSCHYYCIVIKVIVEEIEKKDLLELILKAFKMKCFDYGIDNITGIYYDTHVISYIKKSEFSERSILAAIFNNIINAFEENDISKIRLFIGIGQEALHLGDIQRSYQEALSCAELERFFQRDGLSQYQEKLKISLEERVRIKEDDPLEEQLRAFSYCNNYTLLELKQYFAELIYQKLKKETPFPMIQDVIKKTEFETQLGQYVRTLFRCENTETVHHYLVESVLQLVYKHYKNPSMTVGWLAKSLAISNGYLSGLFRAEMGTALNQYISQYRIDKAKALLQKTRLKIYEIACECGFQDENYFIRVFKKQEGRTPLQYREGVRRNL